MHEELLFTKGDMHAVIVRQDAEVRAAILRLSPDPALASPIEDLVEDFYERYHINPIELELDGMHSSGAVDATLTVDDAFRGRRLELPGTRVTWSIPYSGDQALFSICPTTRNYNPPSGVVGDRHLQISHECRAPLDPSIVKDAFQQTLRSVQTFLGWQRADVDRYNTSLRQTLRTALTQRREKVLADRQLDAFLDVPVTNRPNRTGTFAVDPPRRSAPATVAKPATGPGFQPEPAISTEGFSAILSELDSVTRAVERLPRSFVDMPEESLRDVLLVVLNNHFGPAAGETFSRRGKTDILMPYGGDQRAVFIAECKWWKGQKAFSEAIDQLLGYLTWRDTKAALIIFCKKTPADIAAKADTTLQSHPAYKRLDTSTGERTSYTLAMPADPTRELHVALLVVPVIV